MSLGERLDRANELQREEQIAETGVQSMAYTAGMTSYYDRLCTFIDSELPFFFPSRQKGRVTQLVIEWIDSSLLPQPHTSRELSALRKHHAHVGTPNQLVRSIIDDALHSEQLRNKGRGK